MAMKNEDRPVRDDSRLQANVNYGSPTALDKHLQNYQGPGGSLRHLDNKTRKKVCKAGVCLA